MSICSYELYMWASFRSFPPLLPLLEMGLQL
jgi:hypothetical protein